MIKDSLSAVLIASAFAVAGFRLYKKYFQKNKGQAGQIQKKSTSFISSSKEDDYEPYSKK
jgi:hypothetical protein